MLIIGEILQDTLHAEYLGILSVASSCPIPYKVECSFYKTNNLPNRQLKQVTLFALIIYICLLV